MTDENKTTAAPDDLTGVERELWDDAHTAYADEPDTLDRWRRDFLFMRGTEWKHMPPGK